VYPAYALSHTLFPRKISRKRTGIHFPALIAKKRKKKNLISRTLLVAQLFGSKLLLLYCKILPLKPLWYRSVFA